MRCINLDWLEVSAEESNRQWPCNADYFRLRGYVVREREYGTRVWSEVFTIDDSEGHPWIEVRRNPPSGKSDFTGLNQWSCRLRLVNSQCYVTDCVERLRQFMVRHDYIFKRIYRIDIAYDFEFFDYGDKPARFARRYIQGKYRKINQAKLNAFGQDNWSAFAWESLSWGSKMSMVSTKMYNKSLELNTVSKEKAYIKLAWFQAGLVDDPINFTKLGKDGKPYTPEIWRVEFSITSKAERWLIIESQDGKRVKRKKVPHTLDLFDSPDKLWQRFEDLAFHYFRFKKARYKEESHALASLALSIPRDKSEWTPVRKDLCPDKPLFRFNDDRNFLHIDNCTPAVKPDNEMKILIKRLTVFRNSHVDASLRDACRVLIDFLETEEARRFTPHKLFCEVEALRRTLALRMKHPDIDIVQTIAEIQDLLFNDEMF